MLMKRKQKGNAMRYKVVCDHAEYNDSFNSYAEAFAWLNLVRVVFGSNAGIYEVKI